MFSALNSYVVRFKFLDGFCMSKKIPHRSPTLHIAHLLGLVGEMEDRECEFVTQDLTNNHRRAKCRYKHIQRR